MTATDPHPELAGLENEEALRDMLDLTHVGEGFDAPEPPAESCDCEDRQRPSVDNDTVAIVDGHRECPFCRGRIGGGETNE